MPPRFLILTIVAAWLACTGFLLHRDVVPKFITYDGPPFTINLEEEARFNEVGWEVNRNGQAWASARTSVKRRRDGTFDLHGIIYDFSKINQPVEGVQLIMAKTRYHIAEDGRPLEVTATISARILPGPAALGETSKDPPISLELKLSGTLEGNKLRPRLSLKFGDKPEK